MSYNIPDKKVFVQALNAIASKLPESYIELLKAHYRAPKHKITASGLADAAGYRNYNAANLHYGKLARIIMDQLGIVPSENVNIGLLVDFVMPGDQGNEEIIWILRPEVASALEELNWT